MSLSSDYLEIRESEIADAFEQRTGDCLLMRTHVFSIGVLQVSRTDEQSSRID
jgi:hypothetical protein